ncbi:MAG: hypothetical protein LBB81_04635 [Treponema sp.]|jgi:hypothetical protein|nr:hypothetical protein [Treponema sp.]
MNRPLYFFSVLFLFSTGVCIKAQTQPTSSTMMPEFRRQALVLDINARAMENEEVIWDESHQKITIPGTPVGIRLVGSNIIVAVQFTPFIRRNGSVMVAQGQIWINDPERGVSYYTLIQTIPMEFNEPIYFFPLGTSSQLNSSIEIKLTVNPYRETAITENEK